MLDQSRTDTLEPHCHTPVISVDGPQYNPAKPVRRKEGRDAQQCMRLKRQKQEARARDQINSTGKKERHAKVCSRQTRQWAVWHNKSVSPTHSYISLLYISTTRVTAYCCHITITSPCSGVFLHNIKDWLSLCPQSHYNPIAYWFSTLIYRRGWSSQ